MRNIVIAGGTGFLGRELERFFEAQGDRVVILTRDPRKESEVYWDARTKGQWTEQVDGCDVLINLTGKSVDCRYTEENRRAILSSRIESTRVLNEVIRECKAPPMVWLNASSASTYVHSEGDPMTEQNGVVGRDFSMNVCRHWEDEFFKGSFPATRRVALRTSIVLGRSGGAYPALRRLTRLGLGGKQGTGRQMVSWMHIEDFSRAVEFLIERDDLSGPVNLTSPNPVSNEAFMMGLRKSLGTPFGIPQPRWLLELGAAIVGTETELLLKSRFVIPQRLEEAGFEFKYPGLGEALVVLRATTTSSKTPQKSPTLHRSWQG